MTNLLCLSVPAIIGIVAGVIVVLIVIVAVWYIATANTMIRMKNATEEAWSTIDVYLKKRYDLIPNLVETVKGYAKHESSTLEAVIAARNTAINAQGVEAKVQAENALSGTLKSIFALSEAYPALKADSQFLNLQQQLQQVESELSQARKYYNGTVKMFNDKIMVFPSSIVAKRRGHTKLASFEAAETERQNVKISF